MELVIAGQTYRAGKIDARAQFHIVRRLAPVLSLLAPLAPLMQQGKANGMDALPDLAKALAALSDADADYCLFGVLRTISRKQPNGLGWGPVATGDTLMYDDITMPVMLQLVWHGLQHNLSGFFAALPSDLNAVAQTASAPSAG